MKSCSLRVRLLRLLLLPMLAAFVLTGTVSYFFAAHEAEEVYDAQLTHLARILLALSEHEIEEGDLSEKRISLEEQLDLHEYEKHFAYRAWLGENIILSSSNAAEFGPPTQSSGFTGRMIQNEHWRFFVLRKEGVTVEVAERYEVRADLVRHIAGGILLPQLLIIPAFIMVIWLGVAQGLRPLDLISGMIREREPNMLEPIDPPVTPKEILPVIDAINDLIRRTAEVLDKEKHFSNYAAHELRTPLAALKTQLQVALRTKQQAKADALLRETLPAIERLQHLVDQLLTFTRVQRSDSLFAAVDFSSLCETTARDMAAQLTSNQRQFESHITPGLTLYGQHEMLQALLRNLLDNAVKYTQEGGKITLRLQPEHHGIRLSVVDDGIGIDEAHKTQLFDSFYRAASGHADGSGLGLAIVKWVADAHHATIAISEGPEHKGSNFNLLFPQLKEAL
jgi:signal transduction histidine kinase